MMEKDNVPIVSSVSEYSPIPCESGSDIDIHVPLISDSVILPHSSLVPEAHSHF